MSRSGYSYELDEWALIRWRGAVASAARGKRGQALFREMAAALDAMPEKRLIKNDLEKDGEVCALGAVARCRGLDVADLDPDDYESVADVFGIAPALAREIVAENDEWACTPEERWQRMRKWVARNLRDVDIPEPREVAAEVEAQ